jgi:hypothetical protein
VSLEKSTFADITAEVGVWEAWEQDYSSLELANAEFVTACLSEVSCPHGKTLPLGRKTMKQIVLSAQVRRLQPPAKLLQLLTRD